MIGNLVTTLRIAHHLSNELASQLAARRAQANITSSRVWVWLAAACLASCFLIALFASPAWAATATVDGHEATFTLFDSIDEEAQTQSNNWFNAIVPMVERTFILLGVIEICWAAAIWAFEKDSLNSFAVEIIKKIMFIGFFYTLMLYAPSWIPTIVDTFVYVGETATGTPVLSTDGIIATGMALIEALWAKAPTGLFKVLGKLGQIFVAVFVTIGIIIAYVIVAAQYFTLKVESYILFAAGAIFLGLGSSSWTKEYVSKYLNYAINVGVRLLVMILILSLMIGAVTRASSGFEFDYGPLLKLLAIALLQAILSIRAPEMAGALLNGGIGLSAGGASGAGSKALSAGGAIAGAGLSAAQGANNFRKAVGAGSELAKQQGKSGGAAMLSGLGAAAAAVGRAAPGKLMNVAKRATGGGHGAKQPGVFAAAKADLKKKSKGDDNKSGGAGAQNLMPKSGGGQDGNGGGAPGSKAGGDGKGGSGSAKQSSGSSSSDSGTSLGTGPSGAGGSSTPGSASSDSSSASRSPNKLRKASPPRGDSNSN